jgi:hypothetical protein
MVTLSTATVVIFQITAELRSALNEHLGAVRGDPVRRSFSSIYVIFNRDRDSDQASQWYAHSPGNSTLSLASILGSRS